MATTVVPLPGECESIVVVDQGATNPNNNNNNTIGRAIRRAASATDGRGSLREQC
jgi:hypothetical protein